MKCEVLNFFKKIRRAFFAIVLVLLTSHFTLRTSHLFAEGLSDDDIYRVYRSAGGQARFDLSNLGRSLQESGDFTPEGTAIPNFVPIEARIGLMFMSALTYVIDIVYSGLLPFLNALIVVMFMFWVLIITWEMMAAGKGGGLELGVKIAKRSAIIIVWMWVLNNNPAEMFMWIMAPVIAFGSAISDLVLNSTANIVGTNLPDTCGAIHAWIDGRDDLAISSAAAADLLCMPTRVAGFLWTVVLAGWQWLVTGLGGTVFAPVTLIRGGIVQFGHSVATMLLGLIFIILFVFNIIKFAVAALGVIMDLFFILLFLPFTAYSQCFKGAEVGKGHFASIWSALAKIVPDQNLDDQVRKFFKAILYFVVLSLISAIAIVLLAGVNPYDGADALTVLIVGALVAYLLGGADGYIEKFGGGIDKSFGEERRKEVEGIIGRVKTFAKDMKKAAGKK